MEDFSKLSSKTVTEVLMLELKMSPAAKTFLISGFPRNMRDVVEYSNKVCTQGAVNLIIIIVNGDIRLQFSKTCFNQYFITVNTT